MKDGIEIEIIVRQRKNGRACGKPGHLIVSRPTESASLKERIRITGALAARANDFMNTRLVR